MKEGLKKLKEVRKEFEKELFIPGDKEGMNVELDVYKRQEVELPLGKRWSLNVEYKCPWWSDSEMCIRDRKNPEGGSSERTIRITVKS